MTAVIDKDTIFSNNSANVSRNVITSCLGQISAYGLEVQLDPIYPMYCLIYNEGYHSVTSVPPADQNSFTTVVEQVSATTDQKTTFTESAAPATTERSNKEFHDWEEIVTNVLTKRLPLITTPTSRDTTSDAHKNITVTFGPEWWTNGANTNYDKTASTQQNPFSTSLTSTIGQQIWTDHVNTNSKRTTSTQQSELTSSKLTTTQSWTDHMMTTYTGSNKITSEKQHSLTTSTTQSIDTELPPWTDRLVNDLEETMIATGGTDTETQLSTTMDSDSTSSSDNDGGLTTKSSTTVSSSISRGHSTDPVSTIQMILQSDAGTTKAIMPTLDSLEDFQANEEDYHAWTNSHHDLFPVAIISLVFLCAVCIAVCVIMAVVIFMACEKRSGNVRDHGYYKGMPFTDKGQDETYNGVKEHSV